MNRPSIAGQIGICLLAQGVAFFWTPFLFTNDGPQHLLTAHVLAHASDPSAPFFGDWGVATTLTDHGYKQTYWLLHQALSWEWAHVVASWLPLAASLVGWLLLAAREEAVGAGRGFLLRAALLTGISIPWHFWIGLLPYQYALACVPFALLVADAQRIPSRAALLALILLVQCACHPLPAMITGLVLFVRALTVGRSEVGRTILVGLPSAFVALGVNAWTNAVPVSAAVWHWEGGPLRQLLGLYLPGPGAFRIVFAVVLFGALGVGLSQVRAVPLKRQALLFIAVVGIAVTPLLPFSWRGWELVGSRFLPVCVPLFFVMIPLPTGRQLRAGATAVAIGWGGAYLFWVAHTADALDSAYRDVFDPLRARLGPLQGRDWQLDVFEMPARPDSIPDIEYYGGTAHMAQILAVEKGGRPLFTQSTQPLLHGILSPKRPPRLGSGDPTFAESLALWGLYHDSPHVRLAHVQSMIAHNQPMDVLVVAGLRQDVEAVRSAGFHTRDLGTTAAGLHLAEAAFVGCTLIVESDLAVPDVLEVGILPRPGQLEAVALPAGRTTTSLAPLPCGHLWLRTEERLEGNDGGIVRVMLSENEQMVRLRHARSPDE